MIVYNTTFKIDHEIHDTWIAWIKQEFIPGTMATNLFTGYKLFRLLDHDESDGITYILQCFLERYTDYTIYLNEFHRTLQQKSFSKWGNRFIAFHTVMTDVH